MIQKLAGASVIFDDVVRADTSPKRNRESSFQFLNRSAREEIASVREFVESCATAYPKTEVGDLIARIRSGNDIHFSSATFELLLYSILHRLGFKLEPHPELDNGSTARPDFIVTTPEGESFYLEAVLASEIKDAKRGGDAIKGVVFDELALVSHHNFLVDVIDQGCPTTQPSGKRLASEILKWLDSLDHGEIKRKLDMEGFDVLPTYSWNHEGWSLKFRPIPLKPDRKGSTRTLIGAAMGGAGFIDTWTPIRDAVKRKGSKYGELNLPLLVAVNIDTFALERIDEMQALYGQEQYVFTVGDEDAEPRMERAPNGAWSGPVGPQYRRVSGAWIFNNITPYTIASRRNTIYLNPWAISPLPESVTLFPHARADGEIMKWADGMSIREILRLSEEWPE